MGEIPKVKYVGSFGIYRVSHNFPEKYYNYYNFFYIYILSSFLKFWACIF